MEQNKKIKVGVLFGGRSAEHEVSLQSAKNIITALDRDKYEVFEIPIDKMGRFYVETLKSNDVIFPVLHGPFGEDGAIQGLLKIFNIPFVGCGVLGSAVAMDKDVSKRLMRDAGLPLAHFIVIHRNQEINVADIIGTLGMPVFVKPANLGSSIGIHKIDNVENFVEAIEDAFLYDTKILVEEFVDGRELDCAILGNENPRASALAEIRTRRKFYNYQAKYEDDDTKIIIPADISEDITKKAQKLSVNAFKTLSCEGMARVELFLKPNNTLIVSEVNTIPGFTSHSIYPKLWEESGMSQTELVDTLVNLAIDRHERDKKLKTTYE